MIEDLFFIEKHAYRQSPVHRLDARVKIVAAFTAIIAIVVVPYSPVVYQAGVVLLLFFAVLWGLSGLSPRIYVHRMALILPLWGTIILFQIFLKNPYSPEFHPVFTVLPGIYIYAESVGFALILLTKFVVSVSFILLLSSTTRMQDLLEGASRMGLPPEFSLMLGMMVRYLFVFGYMFRKIQHSLATRCFDPFDHRLPYRYRLREIGYTIGTFFVRSYEQGERTYTAMLCRGYGRHSHVFVAEKPLARRDWAFLAVGLAIPIAAAAVFSLPR
ncbi:MAG: cobalt ECF transporter T component CbiQ [Methanomicrobiales archaeon]|nr:cobalt ECF transporter T component CbiQ [Methanomicrobiales archaeon]MDD1659722.1 cobalt ECF transporter T component CbiQ [Methanomicrobiales archaeon]